MLIAYTRRLRGWGFHFIRERKERKNTNALFINPHYVFGYRGI